MYVALTENIEFRHSARVWVESWLGRSVLEDRLQRCYVWAYWLIFIFLLHLYARNGGRRNAEIQKRSSKKCKGKNQSLQRQQHQRRQHWQHNRRAHAYMHILEIWDGAGHTTDSAPPLGPCMTTAYARRSLQNSSSVRIGSQLAANRLCARSLSARKRLQRHNCNAT